MKYALLILMIVSYAGIAQANEKTCDLLVDRILRKEKNLLNLPPRIAQSKLLMDLSKRVENAVKLHEDKNSLLKFCEEALAEKSLEGLSRQNDNKSSGRSSEESLVETANSIATTGPATQKILMSNVKEEAEASNLVPDCSIFDFLFCAPPSNPIDNGTISPLLSIAASLIGMEEKICNCVQEKAKKVFPSEERINQETSKRKKDLIDSINDKFGKKFINQYAAHLEEVNFFATNNKFAFGKDDASQSKNLKLVSCSDSKLFENAIDKKCPGKISSDDKKTKFGEVFKLLNLNEKNKPKDYFESLNEKIGQNIVAGEGKEDPKVFSRSEFDSSRGALVKRDKVFLFVNDFISKLSKDPFAMKVIKDEMDTGDTPMMAIYKYLFQYQVPSAETKSKFFDKSIMGEELYDIMSEELHDDTLIVSIMNKLDYASQVHPGLNTILHSREMFLKAHENSKDKDSILDALEDENVMGDLFRKRCDQLISDFSEFICAGDTDKLDGVGKKQLIKLNKELSKSEEDRVITGVIMCEHASGSNPQSGALSFLLGNPAQVDSDSLERILKKDISKHKNLFSRFMIKEIEEPDSSSMNFIRQVKNESYNPSSGVGRDVFGNRFKNSKKHSFLKSNDNKAQINSHSSTENIINTPSQSNVESAQTGPTPSGYTNALMPASSASDSKVGTNLATKNDLREFFSSENKSALNNISDPNDPRLDEIWKLKEENAKFKAQLLELATENERLKLKGLEDQVNELKRKNHREAEAKVNESPDSEYHVPSARPIIRNAASFNSDQGNSFAKSTEGSSSSVSNSGRNSAGSASLSDLKSSLSADALNVKYSSTPVVVDASGSHTAGLEIKSSELTSELLKYITASETDIQTLAKIKSSGMVYKYKVLENGSVINKEIVIDYQNLDEKVKQVLDQRLARSSDKEVQSLKRSYSYAALKIILSNSKR